jgi:LPXTG-motif cell wall-anchored protein
MASPNEPPSRPPSMLAVLLLDLVGMLLVGLSLFMLLVPDQQLIPSSTGLPENTIGLLLFGIVLVALAGYFLVQRMRMMSRLRKSAGVKNN